MAVDPNCAGWRLASPQDDGQYPKDWYDQFDVHRDGGQTWQVPSNAAHLGRQVADQTQDGAVSQENCRWGNKCH